jgi:hypothetical protein
MIKNIINEVESIAEAMATSNSAKNEVDIEIEARDKYRNDYDDLVNQYNVPEKEAIESLALRAANDHTDIDIDPRENVNVHYEEEE